MRLSALFLFTAAISFSSGCKESRPESPQKKGESGESGEANSEKKPASPSASPSATGTTKHSKTQEPKAPAKPDTETESDARLPGEVKQAPAKIRGFDTWAQLEGKQPTAIRDAGYAFAVRYVRLDAKESNLTRREAESILEAGLALMIVQQGAGWKDRAPSEELGKRYGRAAVEGAQAVGYPKEAALFLDVESVEQGNSKDVIAYAEAWYAEVAPHFVPGFYVGPNPKLSAEQLAALPFEHFWKSGTKVPTPAGRGYQNIQHPPITVAGVEVDVDVTQKDERGNSLPWLQPKSWIAPADARVP